MQGFVNKQTWQLQSKGTQMLMHRDPARKKPAQGSATLGEGPATHTKLKL